MAEHGSGALYLSADRGIVVRNIYSIRRWRN